MKDMDKQTLKRVAAGDIEAFEQMMRHYENLVYNIAYRMFSNREDAKDVLQDVFIKVFKNISGCGSLGHFKSWICKITTNTCIDELRKRRNKNEESLDGAPGFDEGDGAMENQLMLRIVSDSKTPEEELLDKEAWRELQNAICSLPEDDRTLIVLRDIHGLSYNELAAVTAQNLGTVKSRLSRARSRLRNILWKRTDPEHGESATE